MATTNNHTSTVTYLGDLRCRSKHVKSGNSFDTDAPVDNNGKGQAFSPTDTVATALASCMLTVMGMKSVDLGVDISQSTAVVTKEMSADPRRISKIKVALSMMGGCDKRSQLILERVALTCPVYNSLHPDIIKDISFKWN